ncbi:MAG: hypothetical protein QOH73_1126 [Gaiellaceae bacterium]|nr:hypothetical protein [Gaiellaceae bacterium]
MPPKKRDVAAEKAAKQKKLLFILLPVAGLVFYLFLIPTLTKKSGGPAVASAATSPSLTTGVVTTPGVPTTVTPTGPAGSIAAPSYSFTANEGQLKRFSGHLKSKDPFAGTAAVTAPTLTAPVVRPIPPSVPGGGGGTTPGGGGTSTPTGSKPAPYVYAVLSVNGIAEGVSLSASFPAASPMFTLDAISGTSVKLSLVAGTFANGSATITLLKGRRITLRNTADGSSYVVQLITVARAAPATPTQPSNTSTSVLLDPNTTAGSPTPAPSPTPPPPTTPTTVTGP